jgi:hypothetical protein
MTPEEATASAQGFTVTVGRSDGPDRAVVIFVDGPEESAVADHDEMPDGAPRCRIWLNDAVLYQAVAHEPRPGDA